MENLKHEDGKFNLRWHDYPDSLAKSFQSLKKDEEFVDVTLACHSQQFTAHKVVLSACSPYFRKLLRSNPCHHPIVILRDVNEEDVKYLIKFMYNGEVEIAQEKIKDFLKTAEILQIRGLTEHTLQHHQLFQKTSATTKMNHSVDKEEYSPHAKRTRVNGSLDSHSSPESNNGYREQIDNNNDVKELSSLLSQALEKPSVQFRSSEDIDDSASDISDQSPEVSEQKGSGLFPPGLEALYRQAGFPTSFLGNTSPSGPPPPPIQQGGLQSHANNPTIGGKLDMMRVRATDPRPCPKCGKIYRSAHTLRTHMEDKHTICPGYRCVLCGTVAKSRNSLHSHMSRQHRGISTKDLPVVPMPAPFDAELASRLLHKAGVKVSPNELAARASPTAPRRSDLPKLDSNFLNLQQTHQFPLPASLPLGERSGSERGSTGGGSEGAEDLRVPVSSSYSSIAQYLRGFNPKDLAAMAASTQGTGMGSALLDTYLTMIAAAGETNITASAALNFHNPASRAAAFAAAAAAAANNGGKQMSSLVSDDNEGELGSDADNDDLSDTEDHIPSKDSLDDEN